jgi:hypothetical protein
MSDGRMIFFDSREASCWLARYYAPYISTAYAPMAVELAAGLNAVEILSDLVVHSGRSLIIIGNNNSLTLGSRQLQVMPGGSLTLEQVVISASKASALVVQGWARVANSTIRNCTAMLNVLSADGMESRGGAVYVTGGGVLEVLHASLAGNTAVNGTVHSEGGAIFAARNSTVKIMNSTLIGNKAVLGGYASSGGAICLRDGSSAELAAVWLAENEATDGRSASFGGAISAYAGSWLNIRGSGRGRSLQERGQEEFTSKRRRALSGGRICYHRALSADCKLRQRRRGACVGRSYNLRPGIVGQSEFFDSTA